MNSLLNVEHLRIEFRQDGRWIAPVDDLSFVLGRHEVLAVVGESGCGKSVSAMAIGGLLPEATSRCSGRAVLYFTGESPLDSISADDKQLRKIRGHRIAYIFQEPSVCLNPVMRIGDQIREVFEIHFPSEPCPNSQLEALLSDVGIPDPAKRLRCYPHELSGGMQQRIMIAMALAARPELLIADEPTTALDVTVQAQVLRLLNTLRDKYRMSILLITHNFGLVGELADRVMVMYAGEIVESGMAQAVIRAPQHPYTRALLAALPVAGEGKGRLSAISGRVPSPGSYGDACRFRERCQARLSLPSDAQIACDSHSQLLPEISEAHRTRCPNIAHFSANVD